MTSDNGMIAKLALEDDRIASDAMAWVVRQRDGDMASEQWLEFSDWLGADSRHAAAFDTIVTADERLDELDRDRLLEEEPMAEPLAEIEQRRPSWLRYVSGIAAVAAVLVLALFLWPQVGQERFETVTTGPGETRTIAVGNTIRVEMNGSTELALAAGDTPVVRLKSGEAAFFVNSPEPSKLRVETADLVLVDRGTSFDVINDDFGVRIAVGDGKVVVNPNGEAIALAPGQTLSVPPGGDIRNIGSIAPADMAGWREKRLTYSDTPLPMVAADLSRALGVTIRVAPGLSQERLTGVIPTTGKPSVVIGEVALLVGGAAQERRQEWILSPR